jgi:Septum formation
VRSLALVALALVAVATGCHHDDDPTQPSDQNVFRIDPTPENAVCMQVGEGLPPEVKELPIIDCAQPHSNEIYQTVDSPDSVYPGVDALGSFARVKCLSAFEDFVGISAFDSVLTYSWLVPSLQSWNDKKDRTVLCVLARRDTQEMVGTMRGAQI